MKLQGTEKWHQDRCGNFTGSRVSDLLAWTDDKWKVKRPSGTTAKVCDSQVLADLALDEFVAKAKKDQELWHVEFVPGKPLKAFEDYVGEVICERLTGEPIPFPETYATRWGHDNEPHAVDAYQIKTGQVVQECEFIPGVHPALGGVYGASPDGLVNSDGQIEIKCPVNPKNHLRCFFEGVPEEHQPQVQGQLLATGRSWCDFISYDPRMPAHLRLFVARVLPQPDYQEKIKLAVIRAEGVLNDLMNQLPVAEGKEE